MLWNGGMLGLCFASLDNALLLPAILWGSVGCGAAWFLEESSGLWKLLED